MGLAKQSVRVKWVVLRSCTRNHRPKLLSCPRSQPCAPQTSKKQRNLILEAHWEEGQNLATAVCSADGQKAKKSGSRGALALRRGEFSETSQLPSLTAVCSAEEQKAKKSGSRGGPTEARKPRIRFLRRIGKRRAHSCAHPSDFLLRRRQCLSALVLITGKFWRWFSIAFVSQSAWCCPAETAKMKIRFRPNLATSDAMNIPMGLAKLSVRVKWVVGEVLARKTSDGEELHEYSRPRRG